MSGPFGSSQWMYNSGGGFYSYEIDNSVRLASSDSQWLQKTFTTTGDEQIFTISWWFKRSTTDVSGYWFAGGNDTSNRFHADINASGTFQIEGKSGGSTQVKMEGGPVLRDPSAWYHAVIKVDTTQGTASDRVKFYLNNELVTFNSNTYPSQNANLNWNINDQVRIGRAGWATNYYDGYMAEFISVDGSALDPTSFGEEKDGIWIPKEYTGSFGTNGFHLDFKVASDLGKDVSGNSNQFTPNNLGTHDQTQDSPTNNFNMCNRNDDSGPGTLREAGLYSYVTSSGNYYSIGTTHAFKGGKWYYEHRPIRGGNNSSGLPDQRLFEDGGYCNSNSAPSKRIAMNIGTVDGSDGVHMVALDFENGYVYRGRNGTWNNGASQSGIESGSGTGACATLTAAQRDQYLRLLVTHRHDTGTSQITYNFGQDSTFDGYTSAGGNSDDNGYGDFKYSPPSGFLAMCTRNIAEQDFDPGENSKVPSDYFNPVIWSGNSTSGTDIVTGYSSDLVWIKSRSNATNNYFFDILRGTNNQLLSNANSAEATYSTDRMTAFNSDGFQVGSFSETNGSGRTFVGWSWEADGSGSSNTDGSITSSVSANTTSGCSIVAYTGTGSNATVGHGLNDAPKFIIIKSRSSTVDWAVGHIEIGFDYYLKLNTQNARTSAAAVFNSTAPTSSVFSVGTNTQTNKSGDNYIAYCFAPFDGFSKFGSYTGNGSTDGPTIFTGFKPAWIMIKAYSGGSEPWTIMDNKRDGPFNLNDAQLKANNANAESNDGNGLDFLANGFKLRSAIGNWNTSGVSYVYAAFAEQPFKYANAR